MKVIRKVVIDIKTDKVIERDDYEYDGPVAKLCGGGGGPGGNSGSERGGDTPSSDSTGNLGDGSDDPSGMGPSGMFSGMPGDDPSGMGPSGMFSGMPGDLSGDTPGDLSGNTPEEPNITTVSHERGQMPTHDNNLTHGDNINANVPEPERGGITPDGMVTGNIAGQHTGDPSGMGPNGMFSGMPGDDPSGMGPEGMFYGLDPNNPIGLTPASQSVVTVGKIMSALGIAIPGLGLLGHAISALGQMGAVPDNADVGDQAGGPDIEEKKRIIPPVLMSAVEPTPIIPDDTVSPIEYSKSEKAGENERRKALTRAGRQAMRLTDQNTIGSPFIYIPSLSKLF